MFVEENPLNLPSIETPKTASLADFVMRSIPSKDCDWGGLRDEAKERLHGRLHLGYTQTQFRLYVHTNPAIFEIAYSFYSVIQAALLWNRSSEQFQAPSTKIDLQDICGFKNGFKKW